MTDKLTKMGGLIQIALFVVAIVFCGAFYIKVMTMDTMPESIILPADKVAWNMEQMGGTLQSLTVVTYVFLFLAVVLIVAFSGFGLVKDGGTAKKSLVTIACGAVLILIAYLCASSEIPVFFGSEKLDLTPGICRVVDTGIWAMYIFAAVAIIGVIFTGITGIRKSS